RRLHLISLVGPGGVHAQDRHLVAVAAMAAANGVSDVVVHALTDGRDTPPRSGAAFLADLEGRLRAAHPGGRIGTVGGRYYGMDRDHRWERTKLAYDAIVHGQGPRAPDAAAVMTGAYARDEADEFVRPTVIGGADGSADSMVGDGDVVIHCNFRADRARQLTHAIVDSDTFDGFHRGRRPRDLRVVTMTEYEAGLPVGVAFPPLVVPSLAQLASELGWRQFHVAETEKYAHVTYFFNGGVERAWPGEERLLVPSPHVATYDLAPAMSSIGVTGALVAAIASDTYDLIVANYASPDMVGHTGDWDATVRALEIVDGCLGQVADAVLKRDAASSAGGGPGALLCITADHGNADQMRDTAGQPMTAHSLNPVPVVLAGACVRGRHIRDGVLADVAPTLLELAQVETIEGMTGRSLLAPSPTA
ncbi:MAG: 2,3-bisphosphoglycerate-independent phosphoglycerate mutase, partial [Candidatus Limnocylindrales bacterium]